MHQSLAFDSPLPLREVLDELEAFGKEWRESKIPPELRAARVRRCLIKVDESRFRLEFSPQGRGPGLIWVGAVATTKSGSRIRIRSEESNGSRVASVAFLVIMVLLFLWQPTGETSWLWLVFAVIIGASMPLSIAWRSTEQAALCAAVLGRVVSARAAM